MKGTDISPAAHYRRPVGVPAKSRQSVHANSGLRTIIESGIDYENLEDATIPIEVVTTSLTDGRERWIGPRSRPSRPSWPLRPSRRSFPPVTIDGDLLVDGGVVNNVPMTSTLPR